MKVIFNNKRTALAALSIVLAGIVVFAIVVPYQRHQNDQRMTSSCANHAIQLRLMVLLFAEKKDRFPSEADARMAFAGMSPKDRRSVDWLYSYGSSCPESYLRDASIGYVFVADGLSTKAVTEHSALVFFCPADSHQRSEQHCHAMIGQYGERLCIRSNVEMIDLLQREIRRAREGTVPYSTNAVSTMEHELKARREHERRREPNKPLDPTALSLRVFHMITVPAVRVSSELVLGRRAVAQWERSAASPE